MKIKLNPPQINKDKVVFLDILKERHSCRDFSNRALSLEQISNLLWSAVGKSYDAETSATRTIPSAGARYPLEAYIVIGKGSVNGLKEGLYHYIIEEHSLQISLDKDIRKELASACLGQDFIAQAPVSLIIAAKSQRTTDRYGQRGINYVHMEVGHACQNIYLMAQALGLGTVEVGAFHDDKLNDLLQLDQGNQPLIVMPVGYAG